MSRERIQTYTQLAYYTERLSNLYLSNQLVADYNAARQAKTEAPNVSGGEYQKFDFKGLNINDEQALEIAKEIAKLETYYEGSRSISINLGDNNITDTGAEYIRTNLPEANINRKITINLKNNPITTSFPKGEKDDAIIYIGTSAASERFPVSPTEPAATTHVTSSDSSKVVSTPKETSSTSSSQPLKWDDDNIDPQHIITGNETKLIDLRFNNIGDVGAKKLAEYIENNRIQGLQIDLSNNKINDDGAAAFTDLEDRQIMEVILEDQDQEDGVFSYETSADNTTENEALTRTLKEFASSNQRSSGSMTQDPNKRRSKPFKFTNANISDQNAQEIAEQILNINPLGIGAEVVVSLDFTGSFISPIAVTTIEKAAASKRVAKNPEDRDSKAITIDISGLKIKEKVLRERIQIYPKPHLVSTWASNSGAKESKPEEPATSSNTLPMPKPVATIDSGASDQGAAESKEVDSADTIPKASAEDVVASTLPTTRPTPKPVTTIDSSSDDGGVEESKQEEGDIITAPGPRENKTPKEQVLHLAQSPIETLYEILRKSGNESPKIRVELKLSPTNPDKISARTIEIKDGNISITKMMSKSGEVEASLDDIERITTHIQNLVSFYEELPHNGSVTIGTYTLKTYDDDKKIAVTKMVNGEAVEQNFSALQPKIVLELSNSIPGSKKLSLHERLGVGQEHSFSKPPLRDINGITN